jgi:hypothetical protein
MNQTSKDLIEEICKVSEFIGKWNYFLDTIDDWTNPHVFIAQNNLKKLKEKREILKNKLKQEFYRKED